MKKEKKSEGVDVLGFLVAVGVIILLWYFGLSFLDAIVTT